MWAFQYCQALTCLRPILPSVIRNTFSTTSAAPAAAKRSRPLVSVDHGSVMTASMSAANAWVKAWPRPPHPTLRPWAICAAIKAEAHVQLRHFWLTRSIIFCHITFPSAPRLRLSINLYAKCASSRCAKTTSQRLGTRSCVLCPNRVSRPAWSGPARWQRSCSLTLHNSCLSRRTRLKRRA